mgnify:CR=1 FL=1
MHLYLTRIIKWISMRRYFRKINLDGPAPLPIFGNLLELSSQTFSVFDDQMLQKYNRICGYFEGSTPVILISDVKLIKAITIKDSNCFVNRRVFDGVKIEPFNNFLNFIKDDEWKNVRAIVTTSFTSAKLKEVDKILKKIF